MQKLNFMKYLVLGLLCLARTAAAQLTLTDVQTVLAQAVTRAAQIAPNSVIAVTDREGHVLGIWDVNGGAAPSAAEIATAVSKAGTAAFLSSGEQAFTSRTAGFIVQQNFPPGVLNKPPGPLVGVNFSNMSFSDINKFKGPGSVIVMDGQPGLSLVPVPGTSLAGTPGGVPLYKGGVLVGGVGSTGDGTEEIQVQQTSDGDEDVALAGQLGFGPAEKIFGQHVFIDGISVPYVTSSTSLGLVTPFGGLPGNAVAGYPVVAPPAAFPYPTPSLGGVTGQLRQPIRRDPLLDDADPLNDTIGGEARLTAAEVTSILSQAAARARTTRAGIRLPRGRAAQVFIAVVNNPDLAGTGPSVLGVYCTSPDTTRFSWDVAVQKARTAVFFSNNTRAFSARTIGFMAQSLYPPGIASTAPGIFFGLQERFSMFNGTNTLNGAVITAAPTLNPNLPNGITIFPGGFPLYRNGVLIGAIGVSGDGIDQDDIIAASGTVDFQAPTAVRADRVSYRDARPPYAKFPRNPGL
jgi:uncharacterized protein GlcG (DUF336 family)